MLWSFMLYALDPTSSLRWAARAQPIPAKPSVGNDMADGIKFYLCNKHSETSTVLSRVNIAMSVFMF